MKVTLNTYPSYAKTYVVDFPKLNGGLNLRELDYRLDVNQSPAMKNLWWQDGVLQCRDGQRFLSSATTLGKGYACSKRPFHGREFFHIGGSIYYATPPVTVGASPESFTLTPVITGVPENRGTFLRYGGDLMYKNRGGYYRIKYNSETDVFTAVDMSLVENAYTPIIVINASPTNGSGTTYQPENRLSPSKEVHYNAAEDTGYIEKTADGTAKEFDLGKTSTADQLTRVYAVYAGNTLLSPTAYEAARASCMTCATRRSR